MFKKRLEEYPGVIVASVVLMPNGTLIPNTLKKNGLKMPSKDWTSSELRALNQYLVELIKKEKQDTFIGIIIFAQWHLIDVHRPVLMLFLERLS